MTKAAIECSPPETSVSILDTGSFFLFELSMPTLSSLSCGALKLHVHCIMTNTSYFLNGVSLPLPLVSHHVSQQPCGSCTLAGIECKSWTSPQWLPVALPLFTPLGFSALTRLLFSTLSESKFLSFLILEPFCYKNFLVLCIVNTLFT